MQRADFFNEVALGILDLTQERLNEVSALQRRQNELLATLLRLNTNGQNSPLDGPREDFVTSPGWADMLEREAKAMHQANQSCFNFINKVRLGASRHCGADAALMNEMDDQQRDHIQNLLEEARGMVTGEVAARTESDMEVDSSDIEGPTVKMEPDEGNVLEIAEAKPNVPAEVGEIIDLTIIEGSNFGKTNTNAEVRLLHDICEVKDLTCTIIRTSCFPDRLLHQQLPLPRHHRQSLRSSRNPLGCQISLKKWQINKGFRLRYLPCCPHLSRTRRQDLKLRP